MSNNSIWSIDRALSGVITSGQCRSGSDGNVGVVHILPNSWTGFLAIRLFNVLSRTLVGGAGGLFLCKDIVTVLSTWSRLGCEHSYLYTFPKGFCAKWNPNSFIQHLNSTYRAHFLRWWPLHYEPPLLRLHIYMCVCVCVLYKENVKKQTYKWMKKDLLNSSTNAFPNGLFKIWNCDNFR